MNTHITMKNITKIYGNVVANDDVNMTLQEGEVLAIVGENGAGKTTLMKVLYGLEAPTSGEIYIRGKKQSFRDPHDAIKQGIGMVQQHFMLFDPFTIAENVVYSKEPQKGGIFFDRRRSEEVVRALGEKYGLHVDPTKKIRDCSVGMQQRVEILKTLYQEASIIIFDEPSAVLTPLEVTELLHTIRELANAGKSIVIITHKLNEVMEVADRVMVMRGGKLVKEMMKTDTSIEEMSFLMVGRRILQRDIAPRETGERCLDVHDMVYALPGQKNTIDHMSLHVDRGEIVGIAGVSGNGQSELIQCLTGLLPVTSGAVTLCGQDITHANAESVRRAGCACIPEDRYLWGSAREADLEEVSLMAHQSRPELSHGGVLKRKKISAFVTKLLEEFHVYYDSIHQKMGELSGGNAQKLIIAREIRQETPLLIAAEPTRGVDIGAIEYIHNRLVEKRTQGDAVLLISSELTEIMELSDRIYVVYEGRIVGEFTRETASEEKLGLLMMGGVQA